MTRFISREALDGALAQLGDIGVDAALADRLIHEPRAASDSDLGVRSAIARVWAEDRASREVGLGTIETQLGHYLAVMRDSAADIDAQIAATRCDSNLSDSGKRSREADIRARGEAAAREVAKAMIQDFERWTSQYRARWGGSLAKAQQPKDASDAMAEATLFMVSTQALDPDCFARAVCEFGLNQSAEVQIVRAAAARLAGSEAGLAAWQVIESTVAQRARERVRERLSDAATRDAAVRLSELAKLEQSYRAARLLIEKSIGNADIALARIEEIRKSRGF